MSKRDSGKFERKPRDSYDTPPSAVKPLLDQLDPHTAFCEPCAGSGALVNELVANGHNLKWASDIEPRGPYFTIDALNLPESAVSYADYIITNPPWDRKILHPMIDTFRQLKPTWLLLDADWCHTKQSSDYMKYCSLMVSVGRVSWQQNGTSGFDNCAWYLFLPEETFTVFLGR